MNLSTDRGNLFRAVVMMVYAEERDLVHGKDWPIHYLRVKLRARYLSDGSRIKKNNGTKKMATTPPAVLR